MISSNTITELQLKEEKVTKKDPIRKKETQKSICQNKNIKMTVK